MPDNIKHTIFAVIILSLLLYVVVSCTEDVMNETESKAEIAKILVESQQYVNNTQPIQSTARLAQIEANARADQYYKTSEEQIRKLSQDLHAQLLSNELHRLKLERDKRELEVMKMQAELERFRNEACTGGS